MTRLSGDEEREYRALQRRAYGRAADPLTADEHARLRELHDAAERPVVETITAEHPDADAADAPTDVPEPESSEPDDVVPRRAKILWAIGGAVAVLLLAAIAFGIGALLGPKYEHVIESRFVSDARGTGLDGYDDVRAYRVSDRVEVALGTREDGARCAVSYVVESTDDGPFITPSCAWPPLFPVFIVDATMYGQLPEGSALFGEPADTVFQLTFDGSDRLVVDVIGRVSDE